jgi:hypothetical protein
MTKLKPRKSTGPLTSQNWEKNKEKKTGPLTLQN